MGRADAAREETEVMKYVLRRVATACLAAAGLSGPALTWAELPAGAAAEILNLQGSGDRRPASAADWSPARPSQPLAAGDFVRTRDSSRMALLFADQTQVRLNQNTVLQVKSVATAAQPVTDLLLQIGRAWAQTRRPADSRLNLQTPAATAGIRGTDWDIEVDADGRTLLTVLSGRVSFSNAQGEIVVASNEAAVAEVGKAPVRIQLTQPRDRVQWVNALVADPLRHLPVNQVPAALLPARSALAARDGAALATALERATAQASEAWLTVFAGAQDVLAGRNSAAERRLATLLAQPDAPVAAYAMLADLQLMQGEIAAAQSTLAGGLLRWPGTPELRAQLAHAQLLADRPDAAARMLPPSDPADPAVLWLARGELARREGDSAGTLAAYSYATRIAPDDDRGWFGLGSANTEREDSVPARAALLQALALKPDGPGYRGELGTLETFRNAMGDARAAFGAALADNPADYVAHTGLGLLHLKEGEPAAALDEFLRAGVMEPRYARAKTYTAVAYYQLERREDAIATLQQAIALDDKDPLPWMFLAQIYTDLYRAGDAVQASRAAMARMPYLRSLNQLANDQQGRANLGASMAFFGMEEWALELAQQSYHPYWGGSHLFLADRYPGEFNKNSELFQGFLADPLSFGGSPRFSSLLQQPGIYGIVTASFDREFYRLWGPSLSANGLRQGDHPFAFFAKVQRASVSGMPIDQGVSNLPASFDPSGRADARAGVDTLALGMRPTERLGVLVYLTQTDIRVRGHNQVDLFGDGSTTSSNVDNATRQEVLGFSYRWSPVSQSWLKFGRSTDRTSLDSMPALFAQGAISGNLGLFGTLNKQYSDLQARHTFDLDRDTRLSVGYEYVKERQYNEVSGAGPIQATLLGQSFGDTMVFGGFNDIDRRFSAITLAAEGRLTPTVRIDGALVGNQLKHNVHGETTAGFIALQAADQQAADQQKTDHLTTPRLGIVYQPTPGLTLRAAYQDWLRPLTVSTLNSVQTAGIPIEDRLVEAGGRLRRNVVQAGLTVGDDTFLAGRLDHLRVDNPLSPGVDLRTPSMPFLEELRNTQVVNLSTTDVLEATPSFERGTLNAAALSVNHMFDRQVSGYVKYLYQQSSSSYAGDSTTGDITGKRIPYLPRDTLVAGATWAGIDHWYLSGRLVYRSQRFEDKENLTARPAGTNLDLMGFWETADKHWVLGAAALNLLGQKSQRQIRRWVIDVRYRF